MRRPKKAVPLTIGQGHLRVSGQAGPVEYSIQGDPSGLRFGRARLRATLTGAPELVEGAFRAGSGALTLEGGEQLRAEMVGHTVGGRDVFVEVFI